MAAARKSAAVKRTSSARAKASRTRRVAKNAARGQRPWLMGMVLLLVVLGSMAWAPIKNLSAGAERIEQLTASRDQLTAEVDKLDERKEQLMDPQQLELIAREEYGLVKPGEIPYVVVTPEQEPTLGPVEDREPAESLPWYRRFWSALQGLWD